MSFYLPVYKNTINSTKPLLIILTGESNSGGLGLNSDALPEEIGVRSGVKILNNDTLLFENLNIGVNNQLGHLPFDTLGYTTTRHGLELQIANLVDQGKLPPTTYLCKTGQGGTIISNWDNGATYTFGSDTVNPWDLMKERIDTAISEIMSIEGESPQIYIFYSQGLNDIDASTNPEIWKSKTLDLFSRINTRYGATPIFMTQFNMVGHTSLNDDIINLCHVTPLLYSIYSDDATFQDLLHWDYNGLKKVTNLLVTKLKNYF